MRFLLDTATLIFALQAPQRLSQRAAAIFAAPAPEHILELSAVSISEIAIKTTLGKLEFSAENIRRAVEDLDLRILNYTVDHALRLFNIPLRHKDLFDRQIIAQALYEEIPIITSDKEFGLYEGVEIIW